MFKRGVGEGDSEGALIKKVRYEDDDADNSSALTTFSYKGGELVTKKKDQVSTFTRTFLICISLSSPAAGSLPTPYLFRSRGLHHLIRRLCVYPVTTKQYILYLSTQLDKIWLLHPSIRRYVRRISTLVLFFLYPNRNLAHVTLFHFTLIPCIYW